MKKAISVLFCLMLVFALAVPVYAANDDSEPDTSVTEGTPDGDAIVVAPAESAAAQPGAGDFLQPVQVRMEMVGDVPYITRIYEVDRSTDISILLSGFEQDGYQFSRNEIYKQELEDAVETQFASQNGSAAITEESIEAVLAAAAPYVEFNEGGFSGQLLLDTDTIHIEESERSSYAYRVTDVREYNNLDRNDASYVPKTVLKNGMTLQLENIEWVVMGTTQGYTGLIPNRYKAIATYAGTASGSEVSGYVATFHYSGIVEKVTPGKIVYSVVFRGMPSVQPAKSASWPIIAVVSICVMLILAVAVVKLLKRFRAPRVRKQKWEPAYETTTPSYGMDDPDNGGEIGTPDFGDPYGFDDVIDPLAETTAEPFPKANDEEDMYEW